MKTKIARYIVANLCNGTVILWIVEKSLRKLFKLMQQILKNPIKLHEQIFVLKIIDRLSH